MNHTTQGFHQVNSIFGAGYVCEQHGDAANRWVAPVEQGQFGRAAAWLAVYALAAVTVVTTNVGKFS